MQSPVRTTCAKNAGAMATLVVDRLIVICCSFLLFINGVGLSSVTKRCVHTGEAVKLFSDTGGKCEVVSMYMHDKTELFIASWSPKDDVIKIEHMDADYSKKIYMDGNRNVWFLDVAKTDAGKYVFKCDIQIKQLDLELTVLEKLTEEQLQECPDVSKMEFETTTTVQDRERYTKGSHSDADDRITAILVIVSIMGIFLLVFMISWILFAYCMWNKTKSWTEDEVRKWLPDHLGFMEKRLVMDKTILPEQKSSPHEKQILKKKKLKKFRT